MNYSLELHITRMLMRHADKHPPGLEAAIRMAVESLEQGHTCLNLREMAGQKWFSPEGEQWPIPDFEQWRDKLLGSGIVGRPGQYSPLVLDSHLLYFHRYHKYEQKIADFINSRRGRFTNNLALEKLKKGLDLFFGQKEEIKAKPDWQKIAAFLTLTGRFTVISGGPGTGKTTTVAKIIGLMLEQNPEMRICLAAPTGKAAARLQDSMTTVKKDLPLASEKLEKFPDRVSTVHRLLGKTRGRTIHGPNNKLAADLVIIDEASMVDLPLMADLMDAIAGHASLLLLGDRSQLASVQPGAVFADICRGDVHFFTEECSSLGRDCGAGHLPVNTKDPGSDCLVELQTNFRFAEDSDIGLLSRLVKEGKKEEAADLLSSSDQASIKWYNLDLFPGNSVDQKIFTQTEKQFQLLTEMSDPEAIVTEIGKTVILCGLRRGPFGSVNMNRSIERSLVIDQQKDFYHGRPVMILQNDYKRDLYNGDVGIICRDPANNGEFRCFFPNRPESLNPFQLPDHETAYALTVHKSQGSEYNHVVLILSNTISPILTRELLYTGITRARHSVEIWSSLEVFQNAVGKKISRPSGLVDRLKQEL